MPLKHVSPGESSTPKEAGKEKAFNKVLLEAISEGLTVFGENVRHTIYYYLKKDHGLRREDIPKNPEAFHTGLRAIFGSGASVIERHILERLCAKLGLIYDEKEGWAFTDYIKEAKEKTDLI